MMFWANDLRIQFSLCVDQLDSETLANFKDFKGCGKKTCISSYFNIKSFTYMYNVHIHIHNWIFFYYCMT